MDPFTVSPPAWLGAISRPVDKESAGRAIGDGLMSVATAFQKYNEADEKAGIGEAGTFKGINQGIVETRLNQADPLWKQKYQISMERDRLGQVSAWQNVKLGADRLALMDDQIKAKAQMATDEADDQKLDAQVMAQVGGDVNKLLATAPPAFKTARGQMNWSRRISAAKATPDYLAKQEELRQNKEFATNASRDLNEMIRKAGEVTPEFAAEAAALLQIPDLATRSKKFSELTSRPDYITAAKASTRVGLQEQAQKNRLEMLESKEQFIDDRLARRQEFMREMAKMKADDRNKPETKEKFISTHLQKVADMATGTPQERMDQARKVLSKEYDELMADRNAMEPPKGASSTTGAKTITLPSGIKVTITPQSTKK